MRTRPGQKPEPAAGSAQPRSARGLLLLLVPALLHGVVLADSSSGTVAKPAPPHATGSGSAVDTPAPLPSPDPAQEPKGDQAGTPRALRLPPEQAGRTEVLGQCSVGFTEYPLKTFAVPEGKTVHGDRYYFGNGSDIDGVLDGDFFAFSGGTNTISGTVTGDVNVLGSNLNVLGAVGDDVRVMAGEVNVKGQVEGDLLAVAGQIRVSDGGLIGGQTSVAGGQIVLAGRFAQRVKAAGGQVLFSGSADEDVDVEADVFKLEPGSHIKGNLSYSSREEVEQLSEGSAGRKMVDGSITFTPKATREKNESLHGSTRKGLLILFLGPLLALGALIVVLALVAAHFYWLWVALTFLSALVLGFIIIAVFRGPVEAVVAAARKEALKSLGFGVIGHIFAPFAGLLLISLCLTLPAGMIVVCAWGILFYLAKLVVSLALADGILRRAGRSPSPYIALFLGMIPVWILFEVPVLGPLLYWFLVPILGIGAILIGLKAWSRRTAEPGPGAASPGTTTSAPDTPAASAGI